MPNQSKRKALDYTPSPPKYYRRMRYTTQRIQTPSGWKLITKVKRISNETQRLRFIYLDKLWRQHYSQKRPHI